ncbi:Exocyst complex component 5 [Smittium mucronatum]|uniref:Exocyst complex component 5 n=1 Tax=Smittium mucronatum TaxID=133383 RepID=A0A1R0GVI0_9FUNG|nr:Exocyst complex component 5 [Smittium mucronatum]
MSGFNPSRDIGNVEDLIQTIGANFDNLESEIIRVGGNFIRVGEQLDRVSTEKARGEEIKELVDYFSEFNEGKHDLISQLAENGSEGQIKAKKNIEKYSEEFEKIQLDNFEAAYKDKDLKKMSISARTLVAFNGGLSVAKAYINQHPFFLETMIGESHSSIAEESYKSLEGVSDILGPPPPSDRWLVQMLNDTKDMIEKDWKTISAVFPNPIQSYLDNLLSRAEKSSQIAFLRVLCSSHFAANQLVNKLKLFDNLVVTPTCVSLEAAQQLALSHNTDPTNFLGTRANTFLESSELMTSKFRSSDTRTGSMHMRDNNSTKSEQFNDTVEMTQAVAAMMTGARRLSKVSKGTHHKSVLSNTTIETDDNDPESDEKNPSRDSSKIITYNGVLQMSLDRCRDDLFIAFLGGGRYINVERAHLNSAFQHLISPFLQSRSDRKSTPAKQGGIFSIFGSGNGINLGPINDSNSPNMGNMNTTSSSSLNQQTNTLRSNFNSNNALNQFFSSPNSNSTPKTFGESLHATSIQQPKSSGMLDVSMGSKRNSPLIGSNTSTLALAEDGTSSHPFLLSVKIILDFLYVHSESIARSIELSKPIDLQTTAVSLFRTLLDFVKSDYLSVGIYDAMEDLSIEPRSEPNVELSMYTINVVCKSVGLIHYHYQYTIAPLLVNSTNHLLREVITDKNEFVVNIEKRSNTLMNRVVSTSMSWVSYVLGKQRKSDFRPSDQDLLLTFATTTCSTVTSFFDKIEMQCRTCLDANNQTRLLTELGNSLYSLLMDHFKKFTVSYSGGLVVSKDVSKYIETIEKFGIPELTEKFQTLQILAKIFSVPESTLKSLSEEGLLARLDRSVVTSYIQMREDYKGSLLAKLNF